jgi:hypothetical protein
MRRLRSLQLSTKACNTRHPLRVSGFANVRHWNQMKSPFSCFLRPWSLDRCNCCQFLTRSTPRIVEKVAFVYCDVSKMKHLALTEL